MPTVIVPVGLDMGPVYDADGPVDRPPPYYEVHFGGDPQRLTAAEYTAWLGTFADPDAHADLRVDREWLEQYLKSDGAGPAGPLDDPTPLVSQLLDRELLLEYDPDDSAMEEVFGLLRLYPRAVGRGSDPEEPGRYRIGYVGDVFLEVSGVVYQIWAHSPTFPSLWETCRCFVESNSDLASPEQPFDLTADEVARETGYAVPLLVSTGAAFLDPVNYELPRIRSMPLPRGTGEGSQGAARLRQGRGAPVIVPVGFPLGRDLAEGESPEYWDVRVGADVVRLTGEEAHAWAEAAGDLELAVRNEITRDDLEQYLGTSDDALADPGAVVSRLLDRGLWWSSIPAGRWRSCSARCS